MSAVDRLVEQIREFMTDRALQVGDALPTERELGEMFHSSRNTVREALVVLRAFGLVETRPKVGAVVSGGHGEAIRRLFSFHNGISPDSFRDLQGFRRLLEMGVGDHLILHATEADLDGLDAVNDRLLAASSVQEAAQADYEFHEALIALAGNQTTLAAYQLLMPVIVELMEIGKASRPVQANTYEAHHEIIAALRARDRIAYVYLVSRHLEFGLRFVPEAAPSDRHRGDGWPANEHPEDRPASTAGEQ
ncbi:MAG: FCD domain-containing protein [Ancalomicrobiaceae bacterium]|nr:FCD domain-containing protein [Ancalomicrobiaceae bacterium]